MAGVQVVVNATRGCQMANDLVQRCADTGIGGQCGVKCPRSSGKRLTGKPRMRTGSVMSRNAKVECLPEKILGHSESWPRENSKGEKCALCEELKAMIRISDESGKEFWICLRCDRLIDWR